MIGVKDKDIGPEIEHADDEHRSHDMKKRPGKQGGKEPKKATANNIMETMQQTAQPMQGKITDFIKKHDSGNSSGAKKNQLDTLDKLLKKGKNDLESLKSMIGDSNMNSTAASNNSDPNQGNKCPPGQRWDAIQNKCVIDCPQGQIFDYASNTCIIDDNNKYDPNNDPSTGMPWSIFNE